MIPGVAGGRRRVMAASLWRYDVVVRLDGGMFMCHGICQLTPIANALLLSHPSRPPIQPDEEALKLVALNADVPLLKVQNRKT